MSRARIRLAVAAAVLTLAVVAGAYWASRWHGAGADADRVVAGAAAEPATTGQAPSHGPGFVQFQLGQRNVKALLADGPITWIGTSGGLIRYDATADAHTTYDNRTGLLSNGVFDVGRLGDEIWVGTYGGGLSVFDLEHRAWRNYNIPQGLADAFVYDVLHTRSGDVWIATWSGANRVVGGALDDVTRWRLYTVENTAGGLPNDWVYGLAEGDDGEVWLATEGGLARFADGEWRNWDHADGLGAPYETVVADIEFRNDPAQFSSHHAQQKQEQGLEGVTVAYNPNYIVALAIGDDGAVWAGTWGAGLSRFDGERWTTFTVRDGLPGNHVFALKTDAAGGLWVGTSRGLARYDGEAFTVYDTTDGLYSDPVFALALDENGGAWVGSFGGVAWFPRGLTKHGERP